MTQPSTTKIEVTTKLAPHISVTTADTPKDYVKVEPTVESHHILGGIVFPVLLVAFFVVGVICFKKYDVMDRVNNMIRRRSSMNHYNGLRENDFDDDPLLI